MGIDIGSTTIKAVIFTYQGDVVSVGRRETELFIQKNDVGVDEAFWMPDNIWTNVAAVIKESIQTIDDPKKISGVAVSGFGQDGIPINENGDCLYPLSVGMMQKPMSS